MAETCVPYAPSKYSPKKPLRERLLAKRIVNEKTGCWEWTAKKDRYGYGMIKLGGDNWKTAHRASYLEFFGEPGALHVLHKCHNRSCINPDHLYLGTHRDNMEDRKRLVSSMRKS